MPLYPSTLKARMGSVRLALRAGRNPARTMVRPTTRPRTCLPDSPRAMRIPLAGICWLTV